MAVIVRCPSCGQSLEFSSQHVGQLARCHQCGQQLLLAAKATATEIDTLERDPLAPGGAAPAGPRIPEAEMPTVIGRYQVRACLGAGAFGKVYRAYDPKLEREVALKVPQPGILEKPGLVERFLREAKAAARLHHPHIVPVYDTGQDGDCSFIVSAFIEGRTLARVLADEPVLLDRAVRLVLQLAEALAHAHKLGIVHRDVKPANVLVDAKGNAHLTDFGLAFRQDAATALTGEGALLGTPAYMAPEQAAGRSSDPLPASDQYSLGVILYELLTGKVPFAGPPEVVVYHLLHSEPPQPHTLNPRVPPGLETICAKAMAKRPEDRYPSMEKMAAALAAYLRGEQQRKRVTAHARPVMPAPAPSPPPPPPPLNVPPPTVVEKPRPRRVVRRVPRAPEGEGKGARRLLLVLLALAVIGGGAGGIYWLVHHLPSTKIIDELKPVVKGDPKPDVERGDASFAKHDYDEAIVALGKALEIDPNHLPALHKRAYAQYMKVNCDQAIADCTKALEIDPNCAAALAVRSLAYSERNDLAPAEADAKRALEIDPNCVLAYLARADVHYYRKEYDKSLADCKKAVELDGKCAEAYRYLGITYSAQQDTDQAMEAFKKAIEKDPAYGRAFANRGLLHARNKEHRKAIDDCGEAIKLTPNDPVIYNLRGLVYYLKKDYKKAAADQDEAIKRAPQYATAYQCRGDAYRGMEEDDKALADYMKALELAPNLVPALRGRAIVYFRKKDYDRSIDDCSKIIEIDKNNIDAYYDRGFLRAKKKRYEEAVEDYSQAIKLGYKTAQIYRDRAAAYRELGDDKRARQDEAKARQLQGE